MPATPAKTGGAGTGNLNAANTTPHPKPVITDSIMSFILPPVYVLYDVVHINLYILFLSLKV
jgi:hypothetical protein